MRVHWCEDPDLMGLRTRGQERGFTALHAAIANRHSEAATVLLAHGASMTITDQVGVLVCLVFPVHVKAGAKLDKSLNVGGVEHRCGFGMFCVNQHGRTVPALAKKMGKKDDKLVKLIAASTGGLMVDVHVAISRS